MKLRFLLAFCGSIALTHMHLHAAAAEAAPAATLTAETLPPPSVELKALVERIRAKLENGKTSAMDLAPELTEFDRLFAKYRSQKTEPVAQILYVQATLYAQVLENRAKAIELLQLLKTEFPATESGDSAARTIAAIEAQAAALKVQAALIGKPAPELHFKWSSQDGLKTLSALKGKVVVLDFWATWCPFCVDAFPQMRELTARYTDLDVVVLGVTSLQGAIVGLGPTPIDTRNNPTKEYALMKDYMKANDLTWGIAFSDEKVINPEYGITGIPYVAIIAPDGTVRHTAVDPFQPAEEKYAKIDALLKEFGKKLPAASPPKS